ncbi:hypothetical protein SAMN05216489_05530 [Streptomyces sp. 3213]|nr:hypothetical protein [Streptomyces sp. 3213.3]SEE10800.1 hypothetical protein SAMN05216489_05530 [Streptomyces sp. 3213] [Streptomyces sp. 3213.3]
MAQQDGREAPPVHPEHRTTLIEQGPFCFGRCICGWRGPARRARSQARTDSAGHLSVPDP